MDITPKNLLKKLGIKTQNCLNTYIGRADFSHIKRKRLPDKTVILTNITPQDMAKLRLYTSRRSLTAEEKANLSKKIRNIDEKLRKSYTSYREFLRTAYSEGSN